MKIKNVDKRTKEPERGKSTGRPSTTIDKPIPLEQVEKTKYSMKKRDAVGTVGRKGFKGLKYEDGRLKENRKKKSLMSARTHNASAHSFWVRNDIYAAMEVFCKDHNRSKRSVVEESLYNFLIKEGRVQGAEDHGEEPDTASWVKP